MELVFQFKNIVDFMTMSGHGSFVWASYGVTFISLLFIAVLPALKKKALAQQIQRQQRIQSTVKENS